ncbi:hypothetical protein GCM10023347_21630 [Streptomyces chumphonensis]|uniref:DUF4352 domain-containing protein n=1 Tax=Streptomyces chumphonensis TaxID=1214925 RepID=A0A927F394_9ACTN|nr:hypothetical protein [Streptomyces chumphonensis]MBD3933942.1 hypothetical protein [Streptomyces chumphonensis]
MRNSLRSAELLLPLVLTIGCASDDKPAIEPAPASPAALPTEQPPSDAPSSPKAAPEPLPLGKAWEWGHEDSETVIGASGSTTAVAYHQPITTIEPYDPGIPDETWGQLEAKVCVEEGEIVVSQFPWSLAFPDGARVDITGLTGGDLPRPQFPMDAPVRAGGCVRGFVMFPVPKDQRPERIIYAPEGAGEGGYVEWSVPAS